jgi:hypothetical protein
MPSPSESPHPDDDRPDVRSVAKRYHRVERAVSWLVALTAVGAFLVAVDRFGLVPGVAVAAALAVALRAPVLRRGGATRLRSDAAPDAVVAEFASATPPVLAFQWAVADEVRPASDGAGGVYEHDWLLGLRTHSLAVDAEAEAPPTVESDESGKADEAGEAVEAGEPVARVRIEGTLDGQPWGAYAATVREAGDRSAGGAIVDVELLPRRRFGLRSVPQALVADAYYADALAAQGYEVVERSVSVTR